MATYRFVGASAQIVFEGNKIDLKHFGQKVWLTDDEEQFVIENGYRVQLIPEAEYKPLGVTEEEEKKYPTVFAQKNAPEEFLAKKQAALQVLHELRTKEPITQEVAEPNGDQ